MACRDTGTKEFGRAEILSVDKSGRNKVRVRYIDYGIIGVEEIGQLAELPPKAKDFKTYPGFALEFKMVNEIILQVIQE